MKEIKNPSAFPVVATEQSFSNQNPLEAETGMSLRDEFANSAMQAIISNETLRYSFDKSTSDGKEMNDKIAFVSYSIADAMLKARNNQ